VPRLESPQHQHGYALSCGNPQRKVLIYLNRQSFNYQWSGSVTVFGRYPVCVWKSTLVVKPRWLRSERYMVIRRPKPGSSCNGEKKSELKFFTRQTDIDDKLIQALESVPTCPFRYQLLIKINVHPFKVYRLSINFCGLLFVCRSVC
jgi:hypothetical protein